MSRTQGKGQTQPGLRVEKDWFINNMKRRKEEKCRKNCHCRLWGEGAALLAVVQASLAKLAIVPRHSERQAHHSACWLPYVLCASRPLGPCSYRSICK